MATVLVVDDEFGIVQLLEAILTNEGHRVLTAVNGKHGLEALAQEQADLIFLDHMMPVMNGTAMLNDLAADPALRRVPVVVMSVLSELSIAERFSEHAGFIHKPFGVTQIVAITEQLLGKSARPVS